MDFQTIGVSELWGMVRRSDILVMDLRDAREYQKFHIDGAVNYPYAEMAKWERRLPKGKKLVLYCEHGSISMMAAKRLAKNGYVVYTLVGGINSLNS